MGVVGAYKKKNKTKKTSSFHPDGKQGHSVPQDAMRSLFTSPSVWKRHWAFTLGWVIAWVMFSVIFSVG